MSNPEHINISIKDMKILSELLANGRLNHSKIAKKTKLPKNVISYRINNLINNEIIQQFKAIINYPKIGYTNYTFYLKTSSFQKIKDKEIADYAKTFTGVKRTCLLEGNFDIEINVTVKNSYELEKIYYGLLNKYGHLIIYRNMTTTPETYVQRNDIFLHKSSNTLLIKSSNKTIEIDNIDLKIINELEKNCQISTKNLSSKLKISPLTLKSRIKKLEQKKIIMGYTIRINYKKMGLTEFNIFLDIRNTDDKTFKEIINYIGTIDNVKSIKKPISKWDLEFIIITHTQYEIYELMNILKAKYPKEIIKYDSLLIYDK